MSIVVVRVIAPRDNDCFFHVVAYFDGKPIDSWEAAKTVRTDIACAMARELLAPPWDDLTILTAAVLSGTLPPDKLPPALKHPITPLGARLIAAHQNAKHDDNNVPPDLIHYIVWVQFSALEVDDFFALSGYTLKPLFRYTIWGEDALATVCVELLLGKPTAIYAAIEGIDVKLTQANTPFISDPHRTGAVHSPGRSCINFLNVQEIHFDAVEFYALEQTEAILEAFALAQAAIPDGRSQPLAQLCPYRLTAVTILNGGQAAQPGFVKWVNLPLRPAFLNVEKGTSADQFGTQLRIELTFEAACSSDRELFIKLLPEFEAVAGYSEDNGFRRLPSAHEFSNNRRYGWACFPEAAVANYCSEQVLTADSLANAVPLAEEIAVVVRGAASLTLSGLFLPACAGLRYRVQVRDAFGQCVSDNSVGTRKMLFYNRLVSTSLSDHSDWFADFESTFRPFFLDFRPLPGMSRLNTDVVCDTTSNSSYESELKKASGDAAPYYPYFFNLALINSFASFELHTRQQDVRLDRLLAAGTYDLTVSGLDLSQGMAVRGVTVALPGDPPVCVSVSSGVTCSRDLITIKLADRHKERLRESVAELLDSLNADNARAEAEFEHYIRRQPRYQQEVQKRMASPGFTEAGLIDSFRDEFSDLCRVVPCPPALIATITFNDVAVKVGSRTAGYQQPGLKSCTIPVSSGDKDELMRTIIHEVGHVIGLSPDGSGPTFIDKSPFHYEGRGHQGPHCWSGIELLDTYKNSGVEGKCIMFGASSSALDPQQLFCPHCATSIVLADLGSGYLASRWHERPHEELTVDARKCEHARIARKALNFGPVQNVLKAWKAQSDQAEKTKRELAERERDKQERATLNRYDELAAAVDLVRDIAKLTPEEKKAMRDQLEELLAIDEWYNEPDKWQELLEKLGS